MVPSRVRERTRPGLSSSEATGAERGSSGGSEWWVAAAATITTISSASPPCQRSDIRTGAEQRQPAAASSPMTASRKTRNGVPSGRESARLAPLHSLRSKNDLENAFFFVKFFKDT